MADPIGPGDWVECIDARGEFGCQMADGGFLVEGRAYRVESLSRAMMTERGIVDSVRLVGQPKRHAMSGRLGSYGIYRFRLIYRRRDAEALTAKLLVGARAKGPLVPAQVEREGSRETVK